MESTIDLILKGHFGQIKEQVNKSTIPAKEKEHLQTVIEDTIAFLDDKNGKEASELKSRLINALTTINDRVNSNLYGSKKPMQKATGKKKSKSSAKKAS